MNKYLLMLLVFCSCKVTKFVDREVIKVDSSVIEQNEGLQMTLQETIERYEAERETWLNTGVLFDTIYRKDTIVINKVTFDNGRIKTIEGRIIAVNQSLYEKSAELLDAYSTIDSMAIEIERKEIELSKKVTTVTKEIKKSFLPWWIWLLIIIGMAIEWKFKLIKRIYEYIQKIP